MKRNEEELHKLYLIGKLIESYRLEYNQHDEKWLGEKFNKLYDMNKDTLYYMAKIRGILHLDQVEIRNPAVEI